MILFRIRVEVRVHPEYVELAVRRASISRSEAFRIGEQAFRRGRGRRPPAACSSTCARSRASIPTILDRFDMGVHIAELLLGVRSRGSASPSSGHEPMIHPDRFGEIVARNRGADARVFTDEAEALRLADGAVYGDFALRQGPGLLLRPPVCARLGRRPFRG